MAAPAPRDPPSPIEILTSPFARFAQLEAAGGILLLAATAAALTWANSPWEATYHRILDTPVSVGVGPLSLTESNHEWINDGLMAIFFFLVGLEIKREVLAGELSSLKQAAFPLVAAVGGAIVPAAIFIAFNRGTEGAGGWGIPMATDIAFALGLLALLGSRVPPGLKVFVAALAIADDIIAVLVIAVFYTSGLDWFSLAVAMVGTGLSFLANRAGIRGPTFYAVLGVAIWFAVLKSGVHATVAGVLLALTIPVRTRIDKALFVERGEQLLGALSSAEANSAAAHEAIHALEEQCERVQSPLHRIEHALHPWVSFLIMPVFALANAGVHVLGNVVAALTHTASLGIMVGLFLGKPVGICLFARLAHGLRMASLPRGVSWRHILGAGFVCGIGFTMSLFVAGLAFPPGPLLDLSKIATLAASAAAGSCGVVFLLSGGRPREA
jgi:NhaA family Na+:H+ antiporter